MIIEDYVGRTASLNFRDAVGNLSLIVDLPICAPEESLLFCISAFLLLNHQPVSLEDLLDLVPIGINGISTARAGHIFRKNMVSVLPKNLTAIREGKKPLLIRKGLLYCFLQLDVSGDTALVVCPGLRPHLQWVPIHMVEAGATEIFSLSSLNRSKFAKRNSKFWAISPSNILQPELDHKKIYLLQRLIRLQQIKEGAIPDLIDLSVTSILRSHAAINPLFPQYFGTFRTIEIARGRKFASYLQVRLLTEMLVEKMVRLSPRTPADLMMICAQIAVDFLSIHPFINANFRTAWVLVRFYLNKYSLKLGDPVGTQSTQVKIFQQFF